MSTVIRDTMRGEDARSDCENETLDLYLDGELPWTREADLFRHLSTCVTCREHLNGVLAFRRITRDEFVDVPPWADDRLLSRIEEHRRGVERTARLHARDSLWTARTTVSVRSLVLALGVFLLSLAVMTELTDNGRGYVYFEQEYVRFDAGIPGPSEVYVFYPGLTVEAERDEF